MTLNLMGCFATSNSKAEKQSAAGASSATRLSKTTRDPFSLLSNKPVLLPDPDQLLGRYFDNDGEHSPIEAPAPVVVSRIRVEKPFVRRTAFSGPLVRSAPAHDEPTRQPPRLQLSSADFISCSDAEGGARNRRVLRRAASFGGRPQPLPRPVEEVPQSTKQVQVQYLQLPLDGPRGGVAPISPRLQASGTRVFKLEAENPSRARRGTRASGVTGGLPLPLPSLASKLLQPSLTAFELRQLALATDDFAAARCVMKSAVGDVYSARIENSNGAASSRAAKVDVAVLRLPENSQQGATEWKSEIQLLAQISHRNICALKGYCAGSSVSPYARRRQERLLVFAQAANGSLYDHLFGGRSFLDWTTRVNIVLGAAIGLLYIQDCAPAQIAFKEVTASTVLLERDYEPKLAGYGLSVSVPLVHHRSSSVTTSATRSHSNAKLNMHSFGVLLLELLTGINSLDVRYFGDDANFVHWGQQQLMKLEAAASTREEESRLVELVDPRMSSGCPVKGATELLRLGLRCASQREPSWSTIVAALQSIKAGHSFSREHEGSEELFVRRSHKSLQRTQSVSAPASEASSSENEDIGMMTTRLVKSRITQRRSSD